MKNEEGIDEEGNLTVNPTFLNYQWRLNIDINFSLFKILESNP